MRLFLDTNVIISAMLFPNGRVAVFMREAIENHTVVIGEYVVQELRSVFRRKFPERVADLKMTWPRKSNLNNLALYATLLAHEMTGEDRHEAWFRTVYDYTWSRFPDPEHGEWFGYLRRDGSVAMTLKGNHFKGPFHIPRFLIKSCLLLLEKSLSTRSSPV